MYPFIPWIGGKRRFAKYLLPIFEKVEHTCYVELFAGAAAMLFARPEPAKVEVLNDVNSDLTNLYRVVQHHLDEFVRQFRWTLSSREMFEWMQLQHIDTLTDVQRAARFFYMQKLAFGGKVAGQTFGTSTLASKTINLLRIEEELSAARLRLARVSIEHLPWQECLARYDRPHTLFFADPPYWQAVDYGVPFEWGEFEQLAQAMHTLKGKLVLTINDHPDIRKLFAEFRRQRVPITYSNIGAGRGRSKSGDASILPTSELIYCTW